MRDYVDFPITEPKQVMLLKLLHEGSLPLSKARLRLDKQPKVTVDRLNLIFGQFISSIPWDWPRAEVKAIAGYGFWGSKRESTQRIWLKRNVEILSFSPDRNNPTMVTIRIWKNGCRQNIERSSYPQISKQKIRGDVIEASNSNSM